MNASGSPVASESFRMNAYPVRMDSGVLSSIRLAFPIQPLTVILDAFSISAFIFSSPFKGLGKGPKRVDHLKHLVGSILECIRKGSQNHRTDIVSADIQYRQRRRVPDQTADGTAYNGQIRLHILFRRQNHLDPEFSQLASGFPGSEIGIDDIQVRHANIHSLTFSMHRKVNGNFCFSAAVIPGNDDNAL